MADSRRSRTSPSASSLFAAEMKDSLSDNIWRLEQLISLSNIGLCAETVATQIFSLSSSLSIKTEESASTFMQVPKQWPNPSTPTRKPSCSARSIFESYSTLSTSSTTAIGSHAQTKNVNEQTQCTADMKDSLIDNMRLLEHFITLLKVGSCAATVATQASSQSSSLPIKREESVSISVPDPKQQPNLSTPTRNKTCTVLSISKSSSTPTTALICSSAQKKERTLCAGRTKEGRGCARPVRAEPEAPSDRYCKSHKGQCAGYAQKERDESKRCAGVTKEGERCTRPVLADPPLNILDPKADIERFCFQHKKMVLLGSASFYSRNGNWVAFADWIPGYLHPDTQAALRAEMEKPQTSSDVPGYIYTLEIRDPKDPSVIHLKVGRAVNLVKRIDEWGRQCRSKEQVLRGFWPDSETSLMKGRVKPGKKGPCCHRLERLIHLELADLVVHTPYLYEGFPNPTSPSPDQPSTKETKAHNETSSSLTSTPVKATRRSSGPPARFRQNRGPCPDCGTVHKEIFTFVRPQKGRFKAREWDNLVKPVIEKWGRFVSQCM